MLEKITDNDVNHSIRSNWSIEEIREIYEQPLNDLLFKAQQIHRQFFNHNEVQLSTLMNIKTGGCPEDCSYCPQSAHYKTDVKADALIELEQVLDQAQKAKAEGATRFCMGAAWRSPKEKDFVKVLEMVTAVKSLGMESCLTMGMLTEDQTQRLSKVGLDYYNHNLDSSREYYEKIISTRDYDDRLNTLERVRDSGINVCSGGIIGMGEEKKDRFGLLLTLATMPKHPESVPINMLVKVEGTPLDHQADLDPIEFVRTIATARILMPASYVRLSAGRTEMTDELQAMCFFAGANSIFYGEKLLTTENPLLKQDRILFERLGITSQ